MERDIIPSSANYSQFEIVRIIEISIGLFALTLSFNFAQLSLNFDVAMISLWKTASVSFLVLLSIERKRKENETFHFNFASHIKRHSNGTEIDSTRASMFRFIRRMPSGFTLHFNLCTNANRR